MFFFYKERQKVVFVSGKEMNVGTFTIMVLVACFQSAIAHLGGDVLLDILQEGLLLQPHLVNKAAWHRSKE